MSEEGLFFKSNLTTKSPIECKDKKIYLPKVFGFCGGVMAALKLLEQTLHENRDKKIFLLGDIIHNDTVREYFCKNGVEIISFSDLDKIFDLANKDDVIVIPAFGVRTEFEKKIRSFYKNIVDTTCKDVKKVWSFIQEESSIASTIIIHGHPHHPEVDASLSYCSEESSIIIVRDLKSTKTLFSYFEHLNLEEIRKIKSDDVCIVNPDKINLSRLSLANQTTMLYDETLEIANEISGFCAKRGYIFNFCKTICRATFNRQSAAINLLKDIRPDIVLVVGGYNSSNTNNLYKIACNECKNVFYIKDECSIVDYGLIVHYNPGTGRKEDTSFEILSSAKKIAVLAGASCPLSVVEKVVEKIKILLVC